LKKVLLSKTFFLLLNAAGPLSHLDNIQRPIRQRFILFNHLLNPQRHMPPRTIQIEPDH
jgi:hypothetical protein